MRRWYYSVVIHGIDKYTLYNYLNDLDKLRNDKHFKKLTIQLEVGEKTKKVHLQGVVQFKNKISMQMCQKMFYKAIGTNVHLDYKEDGNINAIINYVTKDETKIDGPWILTDDWDKPIPIYEPSWNEKYKYSWKRLGQLYLAWGLEEAAKKCAWIIHAEHESLLDELVKELIANEDKNFRKVQKIALGMAKMFKIKV